MAQNIHHIDNQHLNGLGGHTTRTTGRGFTIVELLIVIVVIAILAAITIVAYNGIQTRANMAKKQTDIASIAKAANKEVVLNGSSSTLTADGQTEAENEEALTAFGLDAFAPEIVVDHNLPLNGSACTTGDRGMTKQKYCVGMRIDDNEGLRGWVVWWNDSLGQWVISDIENGAVSRAEELGGSDSYPPETFY